jgi:hypothetical protein
MFLTDAQKQLIINIDNRANELIFNRGTDQELFEYIACIVIDNQFKQILKSSKTEELDTLCEQYTGFHLIMKLVEQLAFCTSQGIMPKDSDEFLSYWKQNGLGKAKPQGDPITDQLNQTMTSALFELQKIIDKDLVKKNDFLSIVKIFLNGIISTSVDLVEHSTPGSAEILYADIEAVAKMGGLRAIKKQQLDQGSKNYSVSNIDSDDITTAMNYVGQELSTTLSKVIHELPLPLRSLEVFLRGIEALLTNFLNQKFKDPHQVLDDFCEHVHMALNDLESRVKHQEIQH